MAEPSRMSFDPEHEYRAIETALLETARGRWFLAEHGRRARRLDALALQDAIGRLQSSLRDPPALLGQLRAEIEGLQTLMSATRAELLAKPTAAGGQSAATDSILAVAETIHGLAWDLQAREVDVEGCEQIARHSAQMYALSHAHAVQSQRVRQLTGALDQALARLDGLLETVGHEMQLDAFAPLPRSEAAGTVDEALALIAEDTAQPAAR